MEVFLQIPSGLILIAATLGVVLAFLFRRKRSNASPRISSYPPPQVFPYLSSGDKKQALRKLRRVLKDDPDNIEAYLKIGDLLRDIGEVDRAIRIHRALTVKSNLSRDERREILRRLTMDYLAAHRFPQAVATLRELISLDKGDLWAHHTLLSIYEEQGRWEEALETLKPIQRLRKREDKGLWALYKVQAGLELVRRGDHQGAEAKFREAIHIDRGCAAAYLHLGDSLWTEGKLKEATSAWKRLVEQVPGLAHLVFTRLEKAFEELGDRQAMVGLYRDLLGKNPTDPYTLSAFTEFMGQRGEFDPAIRACEQALAVDPGFRTARECLVKLYHLQGEGEKVVEQALALVDNLVDKGYRCRNCGYRSEEPLWRCPQCKKWRTFA